MKIAPKVQRDAFRPFSVALGLGDSRFGFGFGLSILLALALPAAAHAACNLHAPDVAHAGKACAHAWMDANLKLNDLQTVGTHNSYKQFISPKLYAMVLKANPRAIEIDYNHPSLSDELNDGARGLEIDVAYDPKGGLYAHPLGPKLSGEPVSPGYQEAMSRPGYKVLHIQDIDFRSSCVTFIDCLHIIRAWSKAHPGHTPISITMNAKDGKSPIPGGANSLDYDEAAFDAWDAEIRSVFKPGEVITPDMVQGRYKTLREAVLAGNWPTLGQARGKVFFALDEGHDKIALYRGKRTSLEGRMMFVNAGDASEADKPWAAYMTLNEPIKDHAHIQDMVRQGFYVRTRADADTKEARVNDTKTREAAFTSGAQMVSTDYRHPDARFGNDYQVRLPGNAITICNPLRTADKCGDATVEP
jgi:hypothetical protein